MLAHSLMQLPLFEAQWVLWLLLVLSAVSLGLIAERAWFFARRRVDTAQVEQRLEQFLAAGDMKQAAAYLQPLNSFATNVVRAGIAHSHQGADAVGEILTAQTRKQQQTYETYLPLLATIGSNAPFVGLFGTVLGIIRAFADLAGDFAGASGSVMAGISEALIATAVGLLVAIPAVVAFNLLRAQVARKIRDADMLGRKLLAYLKARDTSQAVAS